MTTRYRSVALRSEIAGRLAGMLLFVLGCADVTGAGRIEPLTVPAFLQKPFVGEYTITSVFDHDLAVLWEDTNRTELAFWGERTVGHDGHRAYDFAMPEGTPLLAAAPGIVTRAGWGSESFCPPLGRPVRNLAVVILHEVAGGERFVTAYVHASEALVEVGDHVAAGQPVALSGNTGCSLGPHLHFLVEYQSRREAPSVMGALGIWGERSVAVDPYGWIDTGDDPWAGTSEGSRSWVLWREGQAPAFRRGATRFASLDPPEAVPVIFTDWIAMGVRDSEHLNNEMVELTLNTEFTNAGSYDMTGFTIENNAGDTFVFPAGFRIVAGRAVRVYTGEGQTSDTALYWGRDAEAWHNRGDCVTLRGPDRTLVNRFQFYSDCSSTG